MKHIHTKLFHLYFLLVFSVTLANGQTQVPNFTVTDLNGQPHTLYDYLDSNKFVVLDFFFTNCSFCQYYAPHMQQSYMDFGCNNGNTIFLGIDYSDSAHQVLNFVQTYGTEYPVASGLEGGGDSVVAAYNISSFPSVLLINPQRYLMKVVTSPTTDFVDTVLSLAGCVLQPCNLGLGRIDESSMKLMPVPSKPNETITIQMPDHLREAWLEVVRLDGAIIEQRRISGKNDSFSAPSNSGIYILRISADGFNSTMKLLVE